MSTREVGLLQSSLQSLKDRFASVLKQRDLASQKAQILQEQSERDRNREELFTQLITQLMERQRELNVMLNRANLMLNRAQETNTVLSIEFTDLCHVLPAPENPDLQDRIRRINDLFRNTGAEEAEAAAVNPGTSAAPREASTDDTPVAAPRVEPASSAQPNSTPRPSRSGAAADGALITPPPGAQSADDINAVLETLESELTVEAEVTSSDVTRILDDLFRRTGNPPPEPVRDPEPQPEHQPEPAAFTEREPEPQPQTGAEGDAEHEPNGQKPPTITTDTISSEDSARRWWQLIGKR